MRRVSGLVIGLMAGLVASLVTATIMATVVHGRNAGIGDGSTRDAAVLVGVLLAPVIGGALGYFLGGRRDG